MPSGDGRRRTVCPFRVLTPSIPVHRWIRAKGKPNPRACSHSKTYEVPRSQDNSQTAPLGYYNEYAALHFASNIKVEL